ncbi:DUF6934 family protein [Pedobacter heparinus]|uniref:DUF6934 family protein n=1 Tax=Pedobacter heparinus TaxID=984 RepID=UPI00292E4030|nr:hypothetical protein [Pedobacter heparinus]
MATPNYLIREENLSDDGVEYLFVSKGIRDVVKAVQFDYVMNFSERKVYNLGFGDYDIFSGKINDSINTVNGDVYAVFNTVLSTIPKFFDKFSDAVILVQGSDSSAEFVESCRGSCVKKCRATCKKQHRRINVYRYYVNRNFNELSMTYKFFGSIRDVNDEVTIDDYAPHVQYDSVWVIKK